MKCTKKFSTEETKKELFGYESENKPYVLAMHKANRSEVFFKIEKERNLKLDNSFVYEGEEYEFISIPPFAFENIDGIQSISLSNSIESIGEGAFILCKDLGSISLGSNLKEIGNYAFCGTKLSNISVQQDNLYFSDRNGILLNKQKNKIIFYPPHKSDCDVEIWDTISCIGNYAFSNNLKLKTFNTLSNSISIGDYAFSGCKNLKVVSLLTDECFFGRCAFVNCENIETIKVKAPLSSLDQPVFDDVTAKNAILYVRDTNDVDQKKYWRNFEHIVKIRDNEMITYNSCRFSVEKFPENGEFGEVCLEYCGTVDSNFKLPSFVELGEEKYCVTSVKKGAFVNSKISKVVIPSTLKNIENGAFMGACVKFSCESNNEKYQIDGGYIISKDSHSLVALSPSQKSLDIVNVKTISPFSVWGSFQEKLSIGSSITKIEEGAIGCCPILTNYIVKDNVSYMVDEDCLVEKSTRTILSYPMGRENSEYVISDKFSRIGRFAFAGAKHLKSITISKEINTIGESAFFDCSNLSLILVDNGNELFSSVDGVLYSKDLSKIIAVPSQYNLSSIDGMKTFIVPSQVNVLNKHAFFNNKNIQRLVVQDELTIEPETFAGCDNLREIYVVNSCFVSIEKSSFGENLSKIDIKTDNKSFFEQIEKSSLWKSFKSINLVDRFNIEQSVKFSYNYGVYQLCSHGMVELVATKSNSLPLYFEMDSIVSWNGQLFKVERIRRNVFKGASFEELRLPVHLNAIGENVFRMCKQLKRVYIGKDLTEIGAGTFDDCGQLSDVYTKSNAFDVIKRKKIFFFFHTKACSVFPEKIKVHVPREMFQNFQENSVRNGWGAMVEEWNIV